MLYIKMNGGLPCAISTTAPKGADVKFGIENGWSSRWDWKDFATVERLARYVTAMTGKTYLPVDAGSSCSPRYDLMEAPRVGDEVSYGFNGDYYPCGKITKITKTWQITTSTGKKFRRRGNAPGFSMEGGTWSMVAGIVDERNPSF